MSNTTTKIIIFSCARQKKLFKENCYALRFYVIICNFKWFISKWQCSIWAIIITVIFLVICVRRFIIVRHHLQWRVRAYMPPSDINLVYPLRSTLALILLDKSNLKSLQLFGHMNDWSFLSNTLAFSNLQPLTTFGISSRHHFHLVFDIKRDGSVEITKQHSKNLRVDVSDQYFAILVHSEEMIKTQSFVLYMAGHIAQYLLLFRLLHVNSNQPG